MTAILEHLRRLRAERRATVRAFSGLTDAQLAVRIGGGRSVDVRSTLLALAEDDDRRCSVLPAIFAAVDWRPTEAQRILATLGQTRGYLRAALVGVVDDQLDASSAVEEWGVRQALRHVVNNENRFVADARYAVERLRSAQPLPVERPDPNRGPGTLGPPLPGSLETVLGGLEQTRDELAELAKGLTLDDLAAPTIWAGRTVDVRFMLHRRATHERQHTIQVQKTLLAIGHDPSEAQMLLGQAEIARGALEGMLLGAPDDLVTRDPGDLLPTLAQLLDQARADEHEKVAAILATN